MGELTEAEANYWGELLDVLDKAAQILGKPTYAQCTEAERTRIKQAIQTRRAECAAQASQPRP